MRTLEAASWSTSAWARLPGPAAPRTSASLSAGTRPVAEIRSATSSASALIGGGVPPRRAPPGGAAPSGVVPGVRRCGGRSVSIYPSFEVSAGGWPHLPQTGSTIPLSGPISPTVRDVLRSPLARVWLPVLAAAGAVATLDRHSDAGDLLYFVHQGERLLSARWTDTFADPTLQSGPLQLLLTGAARSTEVLAYVVELGVAALLLFVLGRIGLSMRWRAALGLAAVAVGLTHGAFVDGHPADAVSPLIWVLAALEARRGRPLRAGALIGLSAGLELWGLLGAPVLLLAPRLREAVKGWAMEVAVVIALFAPFVLAGSFRMFEYEWRVADGTLLGLVLAPGTNFGWPLRLLQAGTGCALGAGVALRLRRSVHAVWLAPLVVVVARIALDPLAYGWYWLEAAALALVGAGALLTAAPLRARGCHRVRAGAQHTPAGPPPPARACRRRPRRR